MLTSSFCFVRGLSEEQERTLWSRGLTTWDLARQQPDEVAESLGASRGARLIEAVAEAQTALGRGDSAWFKTHWPERETWRLWKGYCPPAQAALVDIETTGLIPGYDQITVIGVADSSRARVFVAGRPLPGDDGIDRFPEALRAYRLLVTFNGVNFDLPFMERHFKESGLRFDLPHLDLVLVSRAMGLTGGLKDLEKQLGIHRGNDIKDLRGGDTRGLWALWKNGDQAAYQRLMTYCKADCANLAQVADELYRRRWEQIFTPHARTIDFAKIKGKQLSLFD
jgi:uncharacterized protein YprB with RNaseH-like and TPR domain